MGVRRAMQTALSEARDDAEEIQTLGPLIHNPQVIEMLKGRGVGILDKQAPLTGKGTVIIRAHGVPPSQTEDLEACGYRLVNGTCPHVIRIQKLIRKHIAQGEAIIIIGDKGHAEVTGLMGYAGDQGYVVETIDDVEKLPELDRVCVVSQTTQSYEHFDTLLQAIQKRWPDCTVHRTICGSTDRRQKETVEIAKKVDAMIVVGGRNSANTVRLAQLATETGTPTQHVETSDEIDFSEIRKMKTVGITAGASTPNWMIVEVTERIKEEARKDQPFFIRTAVGFFKFLLDTHLFLAFSAVCLGMACVAMHPMRAEVFPLLSIMAAALYIFAMYTFTIPAESRAERFSDPLRWHFHHRWRPVLITCGVVANILALGLAIYLGIWTFLLMLLASITGIVYCVSSLPLGLMPFLRYRRLVDIPGSKDIFMGLAWAAVLVLIPLLSRPNQGGFLQIQQGDNFWLATTVCFFYVFALVAIRSIVFDLRDIQADQIVGRETLPIVLGKAPTRIMLAVITGLLFVSLIAATAAGILTPAGYLMILPVLYTWGYLYLYHKRAIIHGLVFESIVDGKFIMAGILSLIWIWIQAAL